jgi:polyferredoxin
VLAYGAVLVVMTTLFGFMLAGRVPFAVDVLRDRARLYRLTPEGQVENVYTLKIMNKDQQAHAYRIAVAPATFTLAAPEAIEVAAGAIVDVPVRVRVAPEPPPPASAPVTFAITRVDDPRHVVQEASRFLAPRGPES